MQFTQQETRTEPRLVMWATEIGRQLYEIMSFDKKKKHLNGRHNLLLRINFRSADRLKL